VSIITIWGGGGEEGVDIYVELTNEIPGLWQVSGNHTQICDVRFSGQMSATLTNLSYRPQQLSQKGGSHVLHPVKYSIYPQSEQNIYKIFVWKEMLTGDGQLYHQYQQNEQSPPRLNHWTYKKTRHIALETRSCLGTGINVAVLNRFDMILTLLSW
jgi:hypothetical protein